MDSAAVRFRRWVALRESEGANRTQIAAAIGCSEGGLSRILSGSRGVGGQMAAKIERATVGWAEGQICAVDWYEPAPAELDPTGTGGV